MRNPVAPPGTVLELDLTTDVPEQAPANPVGRVVARHRLTVRDLTERLHAAADDPHVLALVAKVGPSRTGLARLQEVRDAIREFGAASKRTVAWAESFGEFAPGWLPYYLATAFGEIWLQPSGDVGLIGVALEARFVRGTLDKIGVTPQVAQRYEYKNAADMLTRTHFTDAHRAALQGLAESVAGEVVRGVAESRNIAESEVRRLMDRAPLSAAEAHAAGLVDSLGYRDEVYAALGRRVPDGTRLRYLSAYHRPPRIAAARRLVPRHERGVVALVHAVGAVRSGRSRRAPLRGAAIGSDTVGAALRAAARDDRVRAVVLRVDSPGGSYVASDAIWREVAGVRSAGRPVVASMGDLAASGGYYIAMGADTIVAEPGTLTGSIGVLSGKLVVDGLLDRLGIGHDSVHVGERARLFSTTTEFSADEWATLDAWLDRVYDDFVAKAAAGRRMDRGEVHEVARGRVWTGADARERGLVDELGGLARALWLARRAAGLPEDADVVTFPAVSPIARIRPPHSSEDPAAGAAAWSAGWGPVAGLAGRLGLPEGGPLLLPYELRFR